MARVEGLGLNICSWKMKLIGLGGWLEQDRRETCRSAPNIVWLMISAKSARGMSDLLVLEK